MAIYLDHAATVPIGKEVLAAYIEAMSVVGNPASVHSQGQNAKRMLEEAREQVAASLGASPIEVTFTSGGTESINLAIKGLYWARNQKSRERSQNTLKTDVLGSHATSHGVFPRVLIAGGEHHATIDAAEWLEHFEGAVVEQIPIDELGRVDLDALDRMLGDDVALVSILLANNEVGTIQPVEKVVEIAARYGVPVHVDAVAAYGYVPIDFHAIGAAVLSVSAHKIAGPVGVGALLISRSAKVIPLLHGGNQQRSRSGTQDAAGAAAFGVAARLATENIPAHAEHLRALRDRLIAGIEAEVPSAVLRGDPVNRLPGNAHFTFPGCEGDSLLFVLDGGGFSVSTGSACQAGVAEPSHVLQAMGLNAEEARGAMRLTLGNDTTEAEIDAFLAALPDAVAKATAAGFADRPVGARA